MYAHNKHSQLFLRTIGHCSFHRMGLRWINSACPSGSPSHLPQPGLVSCNADLYELHYPGHFALIYSQVQPRKALEGGGGCGQGVYFLLPPSSGLADSPKKGYSSYTGARSKDTA